uniref:Exocyst complex component Sec8 n=1 Tax=Mucochytrium quahogii TaxID=96639 RepID=A0A7S2W7V0_9STRA|mmetsp:Transcript_41082/g.66138  ORF Transcript_41082/g.66138 Transcript_41082/m.66138 type:complete len:893 (+) Transcript_41082:3-2681(+)
MVDAGEDDDCSVLVSNLVSADEAIVPTLKSVLERGWSDRFAASLEHFSVAKENELRKVCNFHFHEFSEGIKDIGKLKQDSGVLRKKLTAMDVQIQEKGRSLVNNSESLLRFHGVQRNLTETQDELRRAQSLLTLVDKARTEIDAKEYFEALETIDLLRAVIHGDSLGQLFAARSKKLRLDKLQKERRNSKLTRALDEWIPRVVVKIKLDVNMALTDWFVLAREKAGKIGNAALETVQKHQLLRARGINSGGKKTAPSNGTSNGAKKKKTRLVRQGSSDTMLAWQNRVPTSTVDVTDTCLKNELNLGPVYQYLDIRNYLGEKAEAIEFYKENRLPQVSLQTMIPTDIKRLKPGQFAQYHRPLFEKLTGFFIIEENISRSLSLISTLELGRIWDSILDTLVPIILAELRQGIHSNPEASLDLIQLLISLSMLLGRQNTQPRDEEEEDERTGDYDMFLGGSSNRILDTTRLMDVCLSERRHIANALTVFGTSQLDAIINQEKCISFTLDSPDDKYYRLLQKFGFIGLDMETGQVDENVGGKFPITFAFSSTVPIMCETILDLMDRSFYMARQLGGDLDSTSTTINKNDTFVSSAKCSASIADKCLEQVNNKFEQVICGGSASAEIPCQYAVNLWFLSKACEYFGLHVKSLAVTQAADSEGKGEKKLSRKETSTHTDLGDTEEWWKLQIGPKFQTNSEYAQSRVMDVIHNKIDELLSSSFSVDWTPSNLSEHPHYFVSDLIQYLSITFGTESCLGLLPAARVQAIQFTSCGRISDAMLDMLCGPKVQSINALSVYSLSLDVRELIAFADTSDVPDLRESYTQLDQLVNLLLRGDLEGYTDAQTRARYYSYLSPNKVVAVLKKYCQIPGSSRIYSSSAKFQLIKEMEIKRTLKLLQS